MDKNQRDEDRDRDRDREVLDFIFAEAPKDIEIPTSHKIGDDIILEEK